MAKGIYIKKREAEDDKVRYHAQYWNKDLKKMISIGTYDTEEEAIAARNKHITEVYDGMIDDSIPKTKGLPKGICEVGNGTYKAGIQFLHGKYKDKHVKVHIGTYATIEEAVEARKDFINNLL